MKILEQDDQWVLEHEGQNLRVEGTTYWDDRSKLVDVVLGRGLFVWADGSVEKTAEPDSDPSKYDTPDLPHEDHPKPTTPDSPTEEAAPAKKPVSKRATKANKERAAKKTKAAAPAADKPRRGRPPLYTPEEAAERRRQKNREYSARRTEEQRAAARERARKWREENPDKVKATREKSMQSRADRYANDPEYRQRFNEYQREYKRARRAGDNEGAERAKAEFETYRDSEKTEA